MDQEGIYRLLRIFGSTDAKQKGANIVATCPMARWTHKDGKDSHPSFSIQINSGGTSRWRCFACGEAANQTISLLYRLKDHGGGWSDEAHQFIKEAEYGSVTNRLKRLDGWDEVKRKKVEQVKYSTSGDWHVEGYEVKLDIADFTEILSEIPMYAVERGILGPLARRWHIGYHKNLFPIPRLFFSILDHTGKMVGWSGRALTKAAADEFGKYHHLQYFQRDKYLYGEWLVNRKSRVGFLMEGFMDVVNLDRLGLRNCLGTMGISPSGEQIAKLKEWFDHVIIFPHDDEPDMKGQRAGDKMANAYKHALEVSGVDAMIGPIVPNKRLFNDVIRNPKDPGEWALEDLDWAMSRVRRMVSERKKSKEGSSASPRQEEVHRDDGREEASEQTSP